MPGGAFFTASLRYFMKLLLYFRPLQAVEIFVFIEFDILLIRCSSHVRI
jgi:hypothetical protein